MCHSELVSESIFRHSELVSESIFRHSELVSESIFRHSELVSESICFVNPTVIRRVELLKFQFYHSDVVLC